MDLQVAMPVLKLEVSILPDIGILAGNKASHVSLITISRIRS